MAKTIERIGDEWVKITQTDTSSEFGFLGNIYTRKILNQNQIVKTYERDNHHEVLLQRDKYGRLLLYFYDEEMRFDGGDDRVDHLWVFVKNKADAEKMATVGKLSRLRIPYIAGDETSWMAVHQYLNIGQVIDVHSGKAFPSGVLGNSNPDGFSLDGVRLKSMEGFLQSLKTPDKQVQKRMQALSGSLAVKSGCLPDEDFDGRHLYWQDKTIDRFSDEYQQLLR
jgi:hypothetical protein